MCLVVQFEHFDFVAVGTGTARRRLTDARQTLGLAVASALCQVAARIDRRILVRFDHHLAERPHFDQSRSIRGLCLP